jgi:hypothetical protein
MVMTNTPKMDTVEEIAHATLSGSAHFAAWSAVVSVLDECVPGWCADGSKTAVDNAVDTIRKLAENQSVL